MESKSALVRNVVIAAIVGGTCGALAGAWSVYRLPANRTPAAPVPAATAVVVASSTTTSAPVRTVEAVPPRREAPPAATAAASLSAPPPRALDSPIVAPVSTAAVAADSQDVLERARVLAQSPDVKALVALRESVVLRAAERGERDSPATKQQLDTLDRYVAEARALRLKIDALEFRKAAPEPPTPRLRD